MKSVAADQIKRACQNYCGGAGGRPPPTNPHASALPAEEFSNIQEELKEIESTI